MPETSRKQSRLVSLLFEISLVSLILVGVFFRFNWVNWSQGTNLHPDEYGLTGTLTQLAVPKSLEEYFNTRISPLSPYQKYDLQGQPSISGPDNRMRWGQWPLTIIRVSGEWTGRTGYDEIRLWGRSLSALADTISLVCLFLIGLKLYGRKIALLGVAFSSLAVMQIQQSHFMTVDNFGGMFTTIAMYACVQIAKSLPLARGIDEKYRPVKQNLAWYALFGLAFGMALASKVNLLPVGGMVLAAAFISIAGLKLRRQSDLRVIFSFPVFALALAFGVAFLTFRVTQPMTFRATTGDTSLLTLTPNPNWVESMKVASSESSGQSGGPPAEQWAHRPAILFPLVNMVLWGMGLPLGVAVWTGWGAALWQTLRAKNWQSHLLPVLWAGGYFFFMGTRWVKSVRYFLPIYPFLCLLAAWLLIEAWRKSQRPLTRLASFGTLVFVLTFTLAWASAFTQAIYQNPHTRIQAAQWMYQNIFGPFHLTLQDENGEIFYEPLNAPDGLSISASATFVQQFQLTRAGTLSELTLPKARADLPATLRVVIARDPAGENVLGETSLSITESLGQVTASFGQIPLLAGETYYLLASVPGEGNVSISRNVLANESWDEGLPMPFEGRDPFGGLYRGLTMEVRWPDDENKRQMFLQTLAETDYIVMPSQRAIWSSCRIPRTYPMTLDYYRALFDGRLGFELAAHFQSPLRLGPLRVSDVGGTLAWGTAPTLPLFNGSSLAAEEAFSVYDHPPVWIFKKRADFDLEQARAILSQADLGSVVVQSARDADGEWCPSY